MSEEELKKLKEEIKRELLKELNTKEVYRKEMEKMSKPECLIFKGFLLLRQMEFGIKELRKDLEKLKKS